MIIDRLGKEQPATPSSARWETFREFQQHLPLFAPLREGTERIVQAARDEHPERATVYSAQVGAHVLRNLKSWWHGEYGRRFGHLRDGSARGMFRMTLWNILALLQEERWRVRSVRDPHGFGQPAKTYTRPGN